MTIISRTQEKRRRDMALPERKARDHQSSNEFKMISSKSVALDEGEKGEREGEGGKGG